MVNKSTDVIIIGAGPAGIACAIQLKRYNIDSIIFEKNEIGGLLKNANIVENYLGFPNGISGNKLVQLINKQSQTAKINVKYEIVMSVESFEDILKVKTSKNTYHSKYLVIASGTIPIIPKVPIIRNDIIDKVYFDIYQLRETKGKKIVIIGAGDCAFDYALNLSDFNQVTILNRSTHIKALPILQERCFSSYNIQYLEKISVLRIENVNNQLLLLCNNSEKLTADYLLIAIGRESNLDFIKKDLLKFQNIFQIGDVKTGQFRQTSIATGDGTFTAMNIYKILNQGD
ncbi:MAG: NAD(P)/FAD-dependent oxidoreductase [Candidatus Neomarinimicrobiota bacterium]